MTEAYDFFIATGEKLELSDKGQIFGKPCFKVNGKAFICFFENDMVFKLAADLHQEAQSLSGSKLFDPSRKNRPMKEWVQVSYDHKINWTKYAEGALEYSLGK